MDNTPVFGTGNRGSIPLEGIGDGGQVGTSDGGSIPSRGISTGRQVSYLLKGSSGD